MAADHRNGYADVSFGQMHYAMCRHPEAAKGSALVLLNSRARSSLALLPLLTGFERVVSIDLPGFSLSSPMPEGATMRDVAHGIIQCMDAIGIGRACFFGLHTGHKVAAAAASHWPERVVRIVIAGRSHSLIPDHALRNQAMQAVIDENQLDMAILRMEGRYADDPSGPRGFAAIFKANFAFDFARAVRSIPVPTLVLEIASDREDRLYGRQGEQLIAGLAHARTLALPMTDPTGLLLYVGIDLMAKTAGEFLAGAA